MPRDEMVLLDIAKAARRIGEFCRGLDKAKFLQHPMAQSAILHQLLIIGEAVKRLSPTFREAHPEITWQRIAGMRDVLIHQYTDIDLPQVWDTATGAVPRLLEQLAPLLPKPDDNLFRGSK